MILSEYYAIQKITFMYKNCYESSDMMLDNPFTVKI